MKRNDDFIAKALAGEKAVWNQLQYDRDGIIEASAGTGKTFTLQRIVLKLVSDDGHPVDVKNILLVTFTEKAAGELKDRIRKILEDAGLLPTDFDEATICTIHSFCRELLATYAFENRVPMQMEIGGSNDDLIHRAVRAALLGDSFKDKDGGTFDACMADASIESTDDLAVQAEVFLKKCAAANASPQQIFEDIRKSVVDAMDATSFCFDGLATHGGDKNFPAACKIVNENLPAIRSAEYHVFFPAIRMINAEVSMSGKTREKLNPRVKTENGFERLFDLRPDICQFAHAVQDAAARLPSSVVADLAVLAWPEFLRLKDESAMLTFDDLVTRASNVIAEEAALEKQGGRSALLDAIRRRYRIALVDEFQDTDAKQWGIFRQIFSSRVNRLEGDDVPEPKQGFLLVVGDPKQAIYGWRGADVGTYLAAKEAIIPPCGTQEAQSLDYTYRSTQELIDAFNTIFGDSSGWFVGMEEGGRRIEYKDVDYPEGNERFLGLVDRTGREAVTLLESLPLKLSDPTSSRSGYGNASMCLQVFMENAALEMKRLRSLSPAYTVQAKDGKEAPHRVEYRDMCVLVRSSTEARAVMRVLARHGIPFAYYKEAGLFATEEAETLLAVFDYLDSPGRSGNLAALLLTPLFNVHPDKLGEALSEGGNTFAKLLEKWQEFTAKRDWTALFESVMNETALARPQHGDFEFDRRWTAFRQILDKLLVEKGRSALAIGDFAKLLRAWCKDDGYAGENGALRQKESEGDRVQIMTMHASKGLEFKVVFIATGWGRLGDDANSEKRLYYVALTRAEQKLYLPWTQWSPHQRKGEDEHGVGSVGSALLGNGFLAEGILAHFGGAAAKKVVSLKGTFAVSGPSEGAAKDDGERSQDNKPPELYTLPCLKHRKVQWDSFTSLNGHETAKKTETSEASPSDERQDSAVERVESLLPRNNVSGSAFHEIMETLCGNYEEEGGVGFSIGKRPMSEAICDEAFAGIVRGAMRRNAIANRTRGGDSTEKTLMRMAWNALNREIRFQDGSSFFLKDIPYADRRAEVKFVLDEKAVFATDLPMLGGRERDGRFNGSIDLLVRPGGRGSPMFILDWKTNSLPDFDDKAVEAEMAEAGYDLQFKLYSLAVQRWLGDGAVAGVAYLFVRGGEGLENRCGVFVRGMDPALRDDCRASVRKSLPGSGNQ